MCGIAGAVFESPVRVDSGLQKEVVELLTRIWPRGRDTAGISALLEDGRIKTFKVRMDPSQVWYPIPDEKGNWKVDTRVQEQLEGLISYFSGDAIRALVINTRGIPTTETTLDLGQMTDDEMQPFSVRHDNKIVVLTHNGLISNDRQLHEKYHFERHLSEHRGYQFDIDSYLLADMISLGGNAYHEIQGSWAFSALIGTDRGEYGRTRLSDTELLLSRNYLGLWCGRFELESTRALVWASTKEALEGFSWKTSVLEEMPPYSSYRKNLDDLFDGEKIFPIKSKWNQPQKIGVVISGGLDSTVVATWAMKNAEEVHLLHFDYQCRAFSKEWEAVNAIAEYLSRNHPDKRVIVKKIDMRWLKEMGNSRLTDEKDTITSGDFSAETPAEWVPARNLAMLGVAASYSDAFGLDTICLGANREESAAYNDNSTEFFEKFQFATEIGTSSRVQVLSPLGNLMKPHIVEFGLHLGAPLHLTWSCYRGGKLRCGRCGPCLNTYRAFKIAGYRDPFSYETDPKINLEIVAKD